MTGKSSARLAKKGHDHSSQRPSSQYLEHHTSYRPHGSSDRVQTEAVLASDSVTSSQPGANPCTPFSDSRCSNEDIAMSWLRMTEKQVRRHILSQKVPEQKIVAVLRTMSVIHSGQHSAVASSLTSWFQRHSLHNPVKQNDTKTGECGVETCGSGIAQQSLCSDAGVNKECNATALACRNRSSDMSGVTGCLGTNGGRCAVASDTPQQDRQQGMCPDDRILLGKNALPLPGETSTSLPLTTESLQGTNEQRPATMLDAGWEGVPERATCNSFLEEDDSMFDGLIPLEGTFDGAENGIDVRNLWAGGNSLEAWSDGTVSDQQTFIDSESVTEAILDCFKDPIWRFHDPPDELPSSFTCVMQPGVDPQAGFVMQCNQGSTAGFMLDSGQTINDAQPTSCWNEVEYTPGTLQAWDNSARSHGSGADNRLSGEMALAGQTCTRITGTSVPPNVQKKLMLAEGNNLCGEVLFNSVEQGEATGGYTLEYAANQDACSLLLQPPAQVCVLTAGLDNVASQISKPWMQAKKCKVNNKGVNKVAGIKKGKGKHARAKGKAPHSETATSPT